MVISAREEAKKEQDAIQKKNDQLKAQLADTEMLLRSHQEQLAELKQVMEQMGDDATNPTAPSTPGILSKFDSKDDARDSIPGIAMLNGEITPSYPTSFTHLLQPVLRTDLACYDDFSSLVRISKLYAPGSRASSGSYGGVGLGLALGAFTGQGSSVQPAHPNGSAASISTPSPATPTTPASVTSNGSAAASTLPLKETRFYKRALAEDIEPCLRLDTAPGLSWLARRSVLNSMCEGTLVVEPMPQTGASKIYTFACSLCGEARKDTLHARTHRFRTSENDSAQRYPLCKYCLGRIRSCCDFLGFLRVLKDGHWRTDDEEAEKAAWEESVRLREQMFWCRIGGGVVPAGQKSEHVHPENSPEAMTDEKELEAMESLQELERTGIFKPRDITPIDVTKSVKPSRRSDESQASFVRQSEDSANKPTMPLDGEGAVDEAAKKADGHRLSLTIPGSFES